jgi:hypothetical protein
MRLTKAARTELRRVLYDAERAAEYLRSDDVVVARRKEQPTTTLDYVRHEDTTVLTEVNKEYGSDLTGLAAAIDRLASFLATH